MSSIVAAFDFEQINSGVYFAAATLPKWLVGIAGLACVTLAFIWLLVSALNRKEAAPPSPPPDYPATTGSP
jgi:hypothetical protein